jgi:hypothetical protein
MPQVTTVDGQFGTHTVRWKISSPAPSVRYRSAAGSTKPPNGGNAASMPHRNLYDPPRPRSPSTSSPPSNGPATPAPTPANTPRSMLA